MTNLLAVNKKPLNEIVEKVALDHALKEIIEKRVVVANKRLTDADGVTYSPITVTSKEGKITLNPQHVVLDEIVVYAQNRCSTCHGKGYFVRDVPKNHITDPKDFIFLSNANLDKMTEEELKLWQEHEAQNKFWRILLPCNCAMRKALRKEPDLFANSLGNVIVRIDWEKAPIDEDSKGYTGVQG